MITCWAMALGPAFGPTSGAVAAPTAERERRPAGAAVKADPYEGLRPFVGDIHVHMGLGIYHLYTPDELHAVGTPDQILDAARSRGLDFVVITNHSTDLNDPRGMRWRERTGELLTLPDGRRTPDEWEALRSAVALRDLPGRFATFLGVEYSGGKSDGGRPGHRIGIFPTDDMPRPCSNIPDVEGECPTARDFIRFVKDHGGTAVTAHPCASWGPSDWSEYDPVINSLEILVGECEFSPNGYNDVLKRLGLRVGARGSSDSHHFGVGISNKTICHASALTREAIFEAMRSNLCYYVDGFPVTLRVSMNGVPMGAEVFDDGGGITVVASASTEWQTDFHHMELIHDGESVIEAACEDPERDACALSTFIPSDTEGYYYVALVGASGTRLAISSPIWVSRSP